MDSCCPTSSGGLYLRLLYCRYLPQIRQPIEAASAAKGSSCLCLLDGSRKGDTVHDPNSNYQGASFFNGHRAIIRQGPSGSDLTLRSWINEIPNDGLIRYL